MKKFVNALLAVMLAGVIVAPGAAAQRDGLGIPSPQGAESMALADGFVVGLGDLLGTRPHLKARSHTSNVSFDGGTPNDGFVLSCGSPVTGSLNRLRATWVDSEGEHTFVTGSIVSGFCPEEGTLDVYVGFAQGTCDDLPAAAILNFTKDESGDTKTAGISVVGEGCSLIDEDPSDGDALLLTGEFDGCLAFTDDDDACDSSGNGGGGGESLPGRMTGGGSFGDLLVTRHGFTLYCTTSSQSVLQVNWAGSSFHLTQLDERRCTDSDGDGTFDTYEGSGIGRCGSDKTTPISFTFFDSPDGQDHARITIAAGAICPGLDESGTLNEGQHTAHRTG